jgi:CDGSH-type Zn-finger protein/truncated hemoglobin YjbI
LTEHSDVASLLDTAVALEASLAAAVPDTEPARVARRLRDSVIRPLRLTVGTSASASTDRPGDTVDGGALDDQVWALACSATSLRVTLPSNAELAEAAAGLQALAIDLADCDSRAGRVEQLEALQSELPPGIQVSHDGPYLATNMSTLRDWLGQDVPSPPQLALCRCGASLTKPFCDGAHATTGFSGDKDPKRVPDRRDTYVGQQVTVLDNRGICQHSGLCSDRLATVFRTGQEPFVAPSGGRMDEIIRAVRDCPSGALGYATDGVEARADTDHHDGRPPAIEITKDGPYRVTGGPPLVDGEGADVTRTVGASREHYALCRCGHSQNKPFCSGMHWYVDFHDPLPDDEQTPTIFEWAGGLPALTRMTRLFYEKHVPEDPLLAQLFANMSDDHPERVARWLAEVFCGPPSYSTSHGGYVAMIAAHVGRGLTEEQRARWVTLLMQSAREAGLPNDPEFRSAFGSYIEWGSRLAVENSQPGAQPPQHMPMPRWDWTTAAGPPGSRISALATESESNEPETALPAEGDDVTFAAHIKSLFRASDRKSMSFAFDLWSYDDVRKHAEQIAQRLRDGTMPCDGAWPKEKVDVFMRWIDTGYSAGTDTES